MELSFGDSMFVLLVWIGIVAGIFGIVGVIGNIEISDKTCQRMDRVAEFVKSQLRKVA
jgi:hypothetical protein